MHQNGSFYIAGTTNSFTSSQDIFVARFNNDTSLVWAKAYDLSGVDGGESLDLHIGASGHLYITGAINFGLQQDACLLKLDVDGNVQWARQILPMGGLAHGRAVLEIPGGDVLIGGSTNSIGAGNVDAFLARFTADGTLVWLNSYGGSGQDHITDLHRLADDTYIINSQTSSFGSSNRKAYTARIASNGDVISAKQYGGSVYDDFITSYRGADGNVLRIGFTNSTGPGQRDILAVLTDSVGNVAWSRAYGTPGNDEWGLTAITRPEGGWFVTAFDQWTRQLYLLHLRPDGSLMRVYQMNDLYIDQNSSWSQAIYPSSDGQFLITANTGPNADDLAIVKLDACGQNYCDMTEVQWSETMFSIPQQNVSLPISSGSTNSQSIVPMVTDITISFASSTEYVACIGSGILYTPEPAPTFSSHPNPVRAGGQLWIDLGNATDAMPVELLVLDVTGKLVAQHRITGSSINIAAPSEAGVYELQLFREGTLIGTGRCIVQ